MVSCFLIPFRSDSFYYKIDKEEQGYQNGLCITKKVKKSSCNHKFIEWLSWEIQSKQTF